MTGVLVVERITLIVGIASMTFMSTAADVYAQRQQKSAPSTTTTCGGAVTVAPAAPPQAADAGFTHLVLDDEFNDKSKLGSTWRSSLPASGYSVANGCLFLNTDTSGYSNGWSTVNNYQHAYFEARVQFNPDESKHSAWPAFWSYSSRLGVYPLGELDFMECYPTGSACTIITTVHQWTSKTHSIQQPNNVPMLPAGTDLTQFHTYGCLWVPNRVTWYFDGQPVMTVATGPGTQFTALEQDYMTVFLGAGRNWPTVFDYVRIWQ
jgi:hypothetical protein